MNNQLMMMLFYGIPAGVATVTSIIVSIFVFSKNYKSRLYRSFLFFSISIGLWSFLYALWFLCLNEPSFHMALFWMRLSLVFAAISCGAFAEFVLRLAGKDHLYRWVSYGNIAVISIIGLFSFSSYLIAGVRPFLDFIYWPIPGILFYFFHFWLTANMAASLVFLFRSVPLEESAVARRRMKAIIIAALIGTIGTMIHFFPWYGIPLPPFGSLLMAVSLGLGAYALLKYKRIDIEVIVRKTLVFAGLFSFVAVIFAFVTFLVQEIFSDYFHLNRTWSTVLSVLAIVVGYDPLKKLLAGLTDRFLFQKTFNYPNLLRDASRGMSNIKSLNHLCSLVVHFITMRVRVRNAGVLSRTIGTNRFTLTHRRGYDAPPLLETIDSSDPLIHFLQERREPLAMDLVDEWIETGKSGPVKKKKRQVTYDYKIIKNRMAVLKAAVCVPSFFGGELRNVLILGDKKSGKNFASADIDVLYTLAQESAIAIENARLYDEAVTKSKELTTINDQLERAQSNLISALNETEIANKRLQDTQAQLIHEQKMATLGRLASSVGHEVNNPLTILSMNVSRAILKYRKDPNLRVSDILDVFQKMEQNIGRIKAVVNTLTGLLKKSEKGKFEALSLKLILEETLPLVQFQTYLDNLSGTEVQFDIPGNVPLIRGDLERLQEVFLNLFINAYHAMMGRRDRKILVTAKQNESNPKLVVIEFSDNGCGMTEDVMKKIFQYGFTTKPVGKGSGMGLYMCRYIIELHGGDIKVKSAPGTGTTFVISLPTFEEETSLVQEQQPSPASGQEKG